MTGIKEVGTLAEIGAQVGDVVEYAFGGKSMPVRYGPLISGWVGEASKWVEAGRPHWRIISRVKPQGPVITETVKRIIPGVYGKVSVTECPANPNGVVGVDLTYHGWWNRADLIAARDVFNQLIDAMPVAVS